MRIPLTLLALTSSCFSALALDLKGYIEWNEACPSLANLTQAKVVLDNGRYRGGVTKKGNFTIPDVAPGTYVLSVLAHDHAFEQLRVDVFEADAPEVRPYFPGTPLSPPSPVKLPYPIVLRARQHHDYFVPRQSFNVLEMFKNPMMGMMVVVGVMMLFMPTLMKNMDAEMMDEFKDKQARINNLQSALQTGDFSGGLSAIMAGMTDEGKPAAGGASASGSSKNANNSGAKQRAGKGKKR